MSKNRPGIRCAPAIMRGPRARRMDGGMLSVMTTRRCLCIIALAAALGVAGCGAGHGSPATSAPAGAKPPGGTPPASGPATLVVRAWADALRRGDVTAATRYFAVPARVANGGPPVRLRSRAEVRFFNETLPCGAKVIASEPATHDFIIVTFVLTERPGGGGCGSGVNKTARTAFRVRNGRITDWLRVQDLPPGPVTST